MYLGKSKIESTVFTSGQQKGHYFFMQGHQHQHQQFILCRTPTEASLHKIATGFTNETLMVAYLVFEKLVAEFKSMPSFLRVT